MLLALARIFAGRVVNRAGSTSAERKREAADQAFWAELRTAVAMRNAEIDVLQANTEAHEVTKDTLRRLGRGEMGR